MTKKTKAQARRGDGGIEEGRDGAFWFRRSVTLPDGRRRRPRTGPFATRADAEAYRDEMKQSGRQRLTPDGAQFFTDYIREWDERFRKSLRRAEKDGYEETIKKHAVILVRWGPRVPLQDLKPKRFSELWATLMDDDEGPGLAYGYVQRIRGTCNLALDDAIRNEVIRGNPSRLTPVAAPANAISEAQKIFDKEQLSRLIEYLFEHIDDSPHHVPLLIAALTGCRRGEAIALRWRDLDLEAGTVNFQRQIKRLRDGRGLVEVGLKSKRSRRTLHLSARLIETLRERQGDQDALVSPFPGRELPHPEGVTHHARRNVYPALGLPLLGVHGLRHTFASHLLLDGVPVTLVSAMLGHADVATTLRTYAHLLEGPQGIDGGEIDRILGGRCGSGG
jgi:integrase